jgi:hypothetical protein
VHETIHQLLDDENNAMDDVDICKEDEGNYGIVERAPPLPDVPPDLLIKKMDLIFSKTLKNVTIEEYYNHGWSEKRPLYGPWLEKKGSFDVSVGDWEYSTDGFENPWSGEKFPQKRVRLSVILFVDAICSLFFFLDFFHRHLSLMQHHHESNDSSRSFDSNLTERRTCT